MLIAKNGDLWVGTFEGLTIIDHSGQPKIIRQDPLNPTGINHNSIRSAYLDDKGSIWLGTYFGGINYYDADNQRFKHYYRFSTENTSTNNVIGAFSEDAQGHLYIGTERDGLYVFDKENNRQIPVPTIKKNYANSIIKSLFTDTDNNLWAGVFKEGLHRYDTQNKTFVAYPVNQPEYDILKTGIINTIVQEHRHLWIGLDGKGGIQKFNLDSKRFEDFPFRKEINELLKYTVVKHILIDGETLLLATQGNGIVSINKTTGDIKVQEHFAMDGKPIFIDGFNHLYKDGKNRLWMATNGNGIITGNLGQNQFKRFDTRNRLSNNIVLGALEDAQGHIWAVTRNGLSKINTVTDSIERNYTYNSGLPLQEINEGAFFKTADHEFLIGGSNGYISFKPENLANNQYKPKLAFTDIRVLNKTVSPKNFPKMVDTDINRAKKLTLTYFQSVLTLDFTVLNFLKPENNTYQYKLEGFDDNWIALNHNRSVTYTNLKPGHYTFKVLGSNNDRVWTDEPLQLELKILPPPWKTWWAYLIYTVLISGGFYVIRYNAVKSTQLKHELKIEQLEKEKWKEIHELKLKYFTDVSHEFRTPLTLVIATLEELMEDKGESPRLNSKISTIYFNAKRLLLLINQILEIRQIETGHSQLKENPLYLDVLLEQITVSFEPLAKKKKIGLEFIKNHKTEIPVLADKDKVEKIFFNLLSNAFKFTPGKGRISLTVDARADGKNISYTIAVKDTGIGMDKEQLPKIFNRFYNNHSLDGAGIGLSLTKSLVDLMGGSIDVISEKGKGTTSHIHLDFQKSGQFTDLPSESEKFIQPLPFIIPEKKDKGKKTSEEEHAEKAVLLLVEDNKELRDYLKEKLGKTYKVLTAKDGKKGLKKARKAGPDLIVSDIGMPEMDGLELCRAIKSEKELSHIPVLLLTAKGSDTDKIEGLESGANDFMSKPFNASELMARIKSILRDRKLLQEKFKSGAALLDSNQKLLSSYDEKLINSVKEIITKHIDNPNLSVDFLSKEVGLSRIHLFRKLKALTGLSPTEYIKDLRMKYATEILSTKKYKASELAFMVGFQDVKYFSKCFRQHTGKSPSKFIKDHGSAK